MNDIQNFDKLFKENRAALLRLASKYISNKNYCEDVVQDALLRAWVFKDNFKGESLLSTWVARIVINTAKNFSKAESIRPFIYSKEYTEIEHSYDLEMCCLFANPASIIEGSELMAKIQARLLSLSPMMKDTAALRYIYGLPLHEIAESQKVGLNTIKSRMRRLRQAMDDLNPQLHF